MMIDQQSTGSASPTGLALHYSGEEMTMMNSTVNPELVAQIKTLVQAWTEGDRRLREMFHGWQQRATRAGLDRGFCLQLAQLPGASAVIGDEIDDMEQAGRMLYRAYMGGAVIAKAEGKP